MSTEQTSYRVITPEFRAMNVALITPRAPKTQPNAAKKFRISIPLLRDSEEVEEILAGIQKEARRVFPTMTAEDKIKLPNGDIVTLKVPFESGASINYRRVQDGKKPYDFLNGMIVFNAGAQEGRRPGLCDTAGRPVNPADIRAGAVCRANIAFKGIQTAAFSGVSCYLNDVLLVSKAAERDAASVFGAYVSKTSDANPFAPAADDDLPF